MTKEACLYWSRECIIGSGSEPMPNTTGYSKLGETEQGAAANPWPRSVSDARKRFFQQLTTRSSNARSGWLSLTLGQKVKLTALLTERSITAVSRITAKDRYI